MDLTMQNLINQGINIGLKILGAIPFWIIGVADRSNHATSHKKLGEEKGRYDSYQIYCFGSDGPAESNPDRFDPWLLWHSDYNLCCPDSRHWVCYWRGLGWLTR